MIATRPSCLCGSSKQQRAVHLVNGHVGMLVVRSTGAGSCSAAPAFAALRFAACCARCCGSACHTRARGAHAHTSDRRGICTGADGAFSPPPTRARSGPACRLPGPRPRRAHPAGRPPRPPGRGRSSRRPGARRGRRAARRPFQRPQSLRRRRHGRHGARGGGRAARARRARGRARARRGRGCLEAAAGRGRAGDRAGRRWVARGPHGLAIAERAFQG